MQGHIKSGPIFFEKKSKGEKLNGGGIFQTRRNFILSGLGEMKEIVAWRGIRTGGGLRKKGQMAVVNKRRPGKGLELPRGEPRVND